MKIYSKVRGLTGLFALFVFLAGVRPLSAEILQTFYIPLPEDQLATSLHSISQEGPFGERTEAPRG